MERLSRLDDLFFFAGCDGLSLLLVHFAANSILGQFHSESESEGIDCETAELPLEGARRGAPSE